MIFIDELDRMKIYKKSFYLPINTKNKFFKVSPLFLRSKYGGDTPAILLELVDKLDSDSSE